MISLPEIYSLSLNRAAIDADHILLPPQLACFLPDQSELDLGDAGDIRVTKQGEIVSGKGLAKKLSRLGNLLQWSCDGDRIEVRGLTLGGSEGDIREAGGDRWCPAPDSSPLLEHVWRGEFASAENFFLARELSDLSVKPGFDQLLSFQVAQGVTTYPHQVSTVRTVLRQMKGRALLCDEVGLGKTVEAGLVTMEYLLRGLVKRVLILTPPSLVHQWQEEMAQKFNQDFVTSDSPEFVSGVDAWSRFPHIIASIDLAKRGDHLKQVMTTRFDLVIVDEAHRLRHRETAAWKLVNGLDKKYILLLTATPVQNDLDELFNLITLLKPGQLKTAAEFRKRFVARGDRLRPQNVEALKLQVSQVMIRNRRSNTGILFTQRRAQTVLTEPSPEEARLYQLVTETVRQFYGPDKKPLSRFTLKNLRMELGSSPAAIVPTVERLLLDNLPDAPHLRLHEIFDLAKSIRQTAKLAALQKTLSSLGKEKVVIFTRYLSTLHWLKENLKEYPLVVYHGGVSAREKDESIERFRSDAQLLLSTDSGGEGRNLQFCHIMVNFDLPWNPMRIEQRIGRLSRIGQKENVYIFNLASRGTVEDHVLEILDLKINLFELVVGELDLILGRLGEEKDLEETIMEMVGTSHGDDELRERLDKIGEDLADARQQYERVKSLDDALFGEVTSG
ncbi:MAG: DEAD/DEAH box helicase family protein [Chloroflexi bacterium]|nr:DEAD/DEAH box helicase family protein [Chloroflexota bacterium]